jgi:hypothetical protein
MMNFDYEKVIPRIKNGFKIKNFYNYLPLPMNFLKNKKKITFFAQRNSKTMVQFYVDKLFGISVNPRFSISEKFLLTQHFSVILEDRILDKKTFFKILMLLEPFFANLKKIDSLIGIIKSIQNFMGKECLFTNLKKDILCTNKKTRFIAIKFFVMFTYSFNLDRCVPFFRNFFLVHRLQKKFSNYWAIFFFKYIQTNISTLRCCLKHFSYIILQRMKKKNLIDNYFSFFFLSILSKISHKKLNFYFSLLIPQVFKRLKKKKFRKKKFIFSSVYLVKNTNKYVTNRSSRRLINNLIFFQNQKKKISEVITRLYYICSDSFFKTNDYQIWLSYFSTVYLVKILPESLLRMKYFNDFIIFFLKKVGLKKIFFIFKDNVKKRTIYTFLKLFVLKFFIKEKSFQKIPKVFIKNSFRYIFQKIRLSTNKYLETIDLILLRVLELIIKKYNSYFSHYLPKVIGLIKWVLANKKNFARKIIFSFFSNIVSCMNRNFPKNLIFHSSIILWENLSEEKPIILAKIVKSICNLLKFFNPILFVPSIKSILFRFLPLFKNRHKELSKELVNFISLILTKKSFFFPKKEALFILFQILEINKNLDKKIRKKCNICLIFFSKLLGPYDVVLCLLNHLFTRNARYQNIFMLNILCISRFLNLNIVFSSLLTNYKNKIKYDSKILFFKIFSCMMEFLPIKKISNFIYLIMILIEEFLVENIGKVHPVSLTIVSQILLKFSSLVDMTMTKKIIILFLIEIFYKKNKLGKILTLFLEKLIFSTFGIFFFDYFLIGTFSLIKKIRNIFWNYKNLLLKIMINHETFYEHFSFRKNSIKNLLF